MKRYHFESRRTSINFHSNPANFKANGGITNTEIKEMAVKTVDRTFLQGQSAELFRAAIKSQATRDPYERRLIGFLKKMDVRSPDAFVEFAKSNPALAENKIIAFLSSERARADCGEISAGTINNWVKAVRLFLEMNDVQLNWKKIRRVLPRARRYAFDRVPTSDELHEILDAADLRGKALTLIFTSSGTREGANPYLHVYDYSHMKREGHLVAGRLQVYSGYPESYFTFITPEAYVALDKYLDFRRQHGAVLLPLCVVVILTCSNIKEKESLSLFDFDLCCYITQCFFCCSHNTIFCKAPSKDGDARHIYIPKYVNFCCIGIR